MKITFWGTRGSLPTPLGAKAVRKKLVDALVKAADKNLDTPEKAEAFCDQELSFAESGTFGGNSSCVQVDVGGPEYLLCDLGSGVREFSLAAIAKHGPKSPQTYHILVSHVHWDHIMGFPFFIPIPRVFFVNFRPACDMHDAGYDGGWTFSALFRIPNSCTERVRS